MKVAAAILGATCLISVASDPVLAEDGSTAGRAVGETIFASMDHDGGGTIHAGDIEAFRASAFAGMDYDGNLRVTYDEFSSWDPGFAYVARQEGKLDTYTTASKIVFAIWDRNGNGELTEPEMRFAMSADFRRADLNDDALLTEVEFLQGFPIMLAMRAALRPDL